MHTSPRRTDADCYSMSLLYDCTSAARDLARIAVSGLIEDAAQGFCRIDLPAARYRDSLQDGPAYH